jgi:hypothetical protein
MPSFLSFSKKIDSTFYKRRIQRVRCTHTVGSDANIPDVPIEMGAGSNLKNKQQSETIAEESGLCEAIVLGLLIGKS